MKKIFIDANVLVDYLDSSSHDHKTAVETIRIILYYFDKPIASPVSFIICNYILSKKIKNTEWHRAKLQKFFSVFEMTPLLPEMVGKIFKTHFSDLEDALQHECALHQGAHLIISKNISDFFASQIPVVHPQDFVRRYRRLFAE